MTYITYITLYRGDKLPPFYIGSTSLSKHLKGYHGTVLSKKYSKIYKQELKDHPELFDSCIIGEFKTRDEATECELYYQKLHDVVKSDKFFNMSLASIGGCHGMDTSGENHPLYGSNNAAGNIHSHNPLTGESAFLPHIPEGFIKGRAKYKASSHNKGKRWYNNGTKHLMAHEPPGPEWTPGKIKALVSDAAKLGWKRHHENSSKR